tara:strand:+ start:83 stop:283 length:201 start_codon:yes stop_codon:yes gene_type:complete
MKDIIFFSMAIPVSIGIAVFFATNYGYYLLSVLLFFSGALCGMSILALADIDISGKVITPRNYRSK